MAVVRNSDGTITVGQFNTNKKKAQNAEKPIEKAAEVKPSAATRKKKAKNE